MGQWYRDKHHSLDKFSIVCPSPGFHLAITDLPHPCIHPRAPFAKDMSACAVRTPQPQVGGPDPNPAGAHGSVAFC
eukprot:jgi/Botrbrau1/16127/Bobra.7_2s0086.1